MTALRWLVFLALFFAWPLPLVGLDGAVVPAARFAQLAAAISVFVVVEGPGGMAGTMLVLLWAHALVYGLLLYGGAWLVTAQGLSRLPAGFSFGLAAIAIAGLLAWGALGSPYETLFHHSDVRASLGALYR